MLALESNRPFQASVWLRAMACLSAWLCLAAVALAQATQFTASFDRSMIEVGEGATLTLKFVGGTPDQAPELQAPAHLSIQSLGQETQFSMVNGVTSSSVAYNYQVTASQPGDYVIPPIQVRVGTQSLTCAPLHLKVTSGNQGQSPGNHTAFLKLVPSKTTVYVGECFPVELQLYLGVSAENLQMPQVAGDGFVFGKIPQPTQSSTQLGNQMFNVVTFHTSAVAAKSGTLQLGPAECSVVLQIPVRSRMRTLFDDPFFGGGVQRKAVTLNSPEVTMTVLPLPRANQPPGFDGAVGTFSITTRASPTNVTAGDPITFRLQIAGRGNLDSLRFPTGLDWPGFKLYPPSNKVASSDDSSLTGTNSFERVVIPETNSITAIPPVPFSFFDPDQRVYRTVTSSAIPLAVRASPTATARPTILAGTSRSIDVPSANSDIIHIKPYLGTIETIPSPLILRPWFLALQSVPLLAWLSALSWRKQREKLANNPRLRRRRQVEEMTREGLKELNQLAQANDSEAFFAAVFHLLQEQIGERLDLPASAITESVLEERLNGLAPDDLRTELHNLFQACNLARYARSHTKQELTALVPTVGTALARLREQVPEPVVRA